MNCIRLCQAVLTLSISSSAFCIDISAPERPEPELWSPAKLLVFGDSLSDSNGDSFRSPDNAYSTFNLLRSPPADA